MADVEKVFESPIDGVIVALGGKTSDVGETMLRDGTKNIISAMKSKGVKRLAVVTSIGAGDSENQAPFFFKVLMWTAMKKIFEDKNAQEEVVTKSGLEYCIVRPGGLTVEPVSASVCGECRDSPRPLSLLMRLFLSNFYLLLLSPACLSMARDVTAHWGDQCHQGRGGIHRSRRCGAVLPGRRHRRGLSLHWPGALHQLGRGHVVGEGPIGRGSGSRGLE
jgi:hypothetical protein